MKTREKNAFITKTNIRVKLLFIFSFPYYNTASIYFMQKCRVLFKYSSKVGKFLKNSVFTTKCFKENNMIKFDLCILHKSKHD